MSNGDVACESCALESHISNESGDLAWRRGQKLKEGNASLSERPCFFFVLDADTESGGFEKVKVLDDGEDFDGIRDNPSRRSSGALGSDKWGLKKIGEKRNHQGGVGHVANGGLNDDVSESDDERVGGGGGRVGNGMQEGENRETTVHW